MGMVGGGCHAPVRDAPVGGNSCEVRCALKAPPPWSTGVRYVCIGEGGEAMGRCGVPRGGNR